MDNVPGNKKRIPAFTIVVIVLVALVISPIFAGPIYNNIIAGRYLHQLEQIPLPEGSEIIDSHWDVGKFSGNGNNTEYFVWIVLSSELPEEEVRHYYETAPLNPARKEHNAHQVLVGPVENGRLALPDWVHSATNTTTASETQKDGCFFVALYDGGYSSVWFDIRGH